VPQSDTSTKPAEADPASRPESEAQTEAKGKPEAKPEAEAQPEEPNSPPAAHLWTASFAALALLLIAALLVGGHYYLRVRSTDQAKSRQDAAVAVARQEVSNLTNLDYRHSAADVSGILDLATGSFRQQFASTQSGFRTVLMTGQVVSKGQIAQTAVSSAGSAGPDSVRVLVAARAVISNTSAKGEDRAYRISVTAVQSQGRWLVSDMNFVS
jgi:Mce-associated membrane protein